jgi:hypothetical protein
MTTVLEKHKNVFKVRYGLPPDRGISHVIPLIPGAKPAYRPSGRHSPAETAEIERQVKELLLQGLIEPSTSPYGAGIVFVENKDKSLRMCLDWRMLNARTIRNRSPLPQISALLDMLRGARLMSSFDLCSAFHQIRISDVDKERTCFHSPWGAYHYLVMNEGLVNASATFQAVMNQMVLKHEAANPGTRIKLGRTLLIYMDDLVAVSHTDDVTENAALVSEVLQLLEDNAFYLKLKK